MNFSEKMKFVRNKFFLSQEMLARELGISFATVSRLEQKHNEPSLSTRRNFAEFCIRKGIKFEE